MLHIVVKEKERSARLIISPISAVVLPAWLTKRPVRFVLVSLASLYYYAGFSPTSTLPVSKEY